MIQMNLMNIRKESYKNCWEYLKTIGYEHSEGCKVKYKRLKNKINLKKVNYEENENNEDDEIKEILKKLNERQKKKYIENN